MELREELQHNDGIILCQPGGNCGCCACCGLFNLTDISRESVTRFLTSDRRDSVTEVRDPGTHICPFQGYVDESGLPGCTVHPSAAEADGRGDSLYGARLCGEYLCPAHFILDEEMKRLLMNGVDSWYEYSIAIIDPASFIWIACTLMEESGFEKKVPFSKKTRYILSRALQVHAVFLNSRVGPLFHYSVSEYFLKRREFSLDCSEMSEQREIIRGTMREFLR